MAYLLDVNVLVALHDLSHRHNAVVFDWFSQKRDGPWASCPITENGLVRVLSQPSYEASISSGLAAELLWQTIQDTDHRFWSDDVSIVAPGVIRYEHLIGHRQITDAYLLALTVAREGRLVTLDRAMPIDAVVGARPEHIVVLGP